MTFAAVAGGVAAAAAVASAGTSIAGAVGSKNAAGQASTTAGNNTALQTALSGMAQSGATANLSPYMQTGAAANTQLAGMLGLAQPGSQPKPDISQFQTVTAGSGKNGQPTMTTDYGAFQQAMDAWLQQQGTLTGIEQNGQIGSLTAPYSAAQYQGDPGYTPMVNSLADLQATPGYNFQLQQGLQSVNNSAAAKGSLLSGSTLKGLNNYAQGQASTGFQAAWDRAQQAYSNAFNRNTTNQTNTFNRLNTIAGSGQNAATTLSSAGQTAAGQQSGAVGTGSAAQQQASYATGAANTSLAGNLNQSVQGGLSDYLLGQYLNNQTGTAAATNAQNPGGNLALG